ncbi:MAG: hypothetical protein H0V39_01820 [Nitrosomonas sp.]|nr:hypothetical protein [Nitrosomonas sp.]
MLASKLNSKKFGRRQKMRRIADQFTTDLNCICTSPQGFSYFELMDDAVLLLDSKTRVIHITSQAEQIVNRSSIPLVLYPRFGLPCLPNDGRFKLFVNQKTKDARTLTLLLSNKKTREALLFSCFSLPESTSDNLNVAHFLIKLRDPIRQYNKQVELITEQYNLTRAEGRLCCALADGLTLNDYCVFWNIKISTGRSHLCNIFYKTQTKGQSGLLRLIYLLSSL